MRCHYLVLMAIALAPCFSQSDCFDCSGILGCSWYGSLAFGGCRGSARPCSSQPEFFCESQGCRWEEDTEPATPSVSDSGSSSGELSGEVVFAVVVCVVVGIILLGGCLRGYNCTANNGGGPVRRPAYAATVTVNNINNTRTSNNPTLDPNNNAIKNMSPADRKAFVANVLETGKFESKDGKNIEMKRRILLKAHWLHLCTVWMMLLCLWRIAPFAWKGFAMVTWFAHPITRTATMCSTANACMNGC